jgi:hypothetical protein
MNAAKKDLMILALRAVLGVVVLGQSCALAWSAQAAETFAHTGWPNALRLALAWSEILAAILFLLPGTVAVGGWSLIVIFLGAAGLHVAHGDFQVGGLLVFAVAALVVLSHQPPRRKEARAAGREAVP